MNKDRKQNEGKPMLAFLPTTPLEQVAMVCDYGAKKYARNNWKSPDASWALYVSASLRHIFAFIRGETHDPESGLHHLAHAVCGLLFLMHHVNESTGVNDLGWPESPKSIMDTISEALSK